MSLKSLKRKKLSETVFDEVMHYINERGFKQGDRLPSERDFCDQLQISRSSFREAIQKLEMCGLIEIRRGSGMYVKSEKTVLGEVTKLKVVLAAEKRVIEEIMDLRELMEQYAIDRIIEQDNQACLIRLSHILDQYEQTIADGGVPRHEDYQFHLALYEGAGNRVAQNFFQSTEEIERIWEEKAIAMLNENVFSRTTETLHRAIYESMRIGDAATAKRLMRKHFQLMRKDLSKLD